MTRPDGRWAALAVLCVAQFMLILDVTVVNVALPTVAGDLGLSTAQLPWVVSAYALVFGGMLILGGRLADLVGPLRIIAAGLTVFVLASAAAGVSQSPAVIIAARAVQGLGAAMLSPAALATVTSMFDGRDRHRALAVWAALGGSGAAFGMLVGGVLVDGPGWRWVFYLNVPVGMAVAVGLVLWRHAVPRAHAQEGRRLDVLGAVTISGAAAAAIYGFVQAGEDGWTSMTVLVALAIAVVLGAAAVVVERSVPAPLVPPSVVRRRSVIGGVTVMLAGSGLLVSTFYLGSLYLQGHAGTSAAGTGLAFLPAGLATIGGAHVGSHLVGRIGWRRVTLGAFLVAGAGLALVGLVAGDGGGSGAFSAALVPAAGGLAAAFVVATTSAMSTVGPHEAGVVSGIVNAGHELGAALTVAIASAVAVAASAAGTAHGITPEGFRTGFLAAVAVAVLVALAVPRLLPIGAPAMSDSPMPVH
jgi:MFS family permease